VATRRKRQQDSENTVDYPQHLFPPEIEKQAPELLNAELVQSHEGWFLRQGQPML
jgi:hypothetical protein